MSWVTFLWSLSAAIALMLAAGCALAWLVDRRDVAKPMFCVAAIATAAAAPFELGMMQVVTTATLGEQLRWYHLPIFFSLLGQVFFVRYYLGTGRRRLLWPFILMQLFVLLVNLLAHPNLDFDEDSSLRYILFLGEQVAVVGGSVPRTWQWLTLASLLLFVAFVLDAMVQAWRQGGQELRHKALMVGLPILLSMMGNLAMNQLIVSGALHAPPCATLWFTGALAVIGYALARETLMNSRARLQSVEIRHEMAREERGHVLGQIAAALAHELAQPLAATQLNMETAKMGLLRPNPDLDDLRAIIDDVQNDNQRAEKTINRMRAISRRRRLMKQAFDLDEVARDVCSSLQPEALSRHVELMCSLPAGLPQIYGDRVQISQVVLNLLINGMDAAQERSTDERRVIIEARTAAAEHVEITVRDSGFGIPEERFEELFKPFFTTKQTGLGVGLALSRRIVDAHGGRLWAEKNEAGSAIFRFTLPLAPAT